MKELFIKEVVNAVAYDRADILYYETSQTLKVFHTVKNNKDYVIAFTSEEFEMLKFLIANAKRKRFESTNL